MSAFDDLVARFLDELFVLQPDLATARRRPPLRRPLAGHRRAAAAQARLAFIDRWHGELEALDPPTLSRRRRGSTATSSSGELGRVPVRGGRAAPGGLGPARPGCTSSAAACIPLLARDFAPLARPARGRGGTAGGRSRALIENAREVIGSAPDPAGLAAPRGGGRPADRRRGGARPRGRDDRRGGRGPTTPTSRRSCPGCGGRPNGPPRPRSGSARHLAARGRPGGGRRAPLGRELFAAQAAPHAARPVDHAGGGAGPGGGRVLGGARRDGPHRARDLADLAAGRAAGPTTTGALVRGVLDAIAAEHPAPDGLVEFCRRELASIEAFCRRARP